jgi:hypothetical protein
MQQQCCQQASADAHPQGRFWHGKGRERSFDVRTSMGTPACAATSSTIKITETDRDNHLPPSRFITGRWAIAFALPLAGMKSER